jgi:protein SCO1
MLNNILIYIFLEYLQAQNSMTSTGEAKVGGPFSLLNQDGKRVTEHDFRGKFMLFYFGFTHCPDICPDELEKATEAIHLLNAVEETRHQVVPIFVTVDPNRDGPREIKSYLKGSLL